MIKKYLTKYIALSIITTSMIALNPIGANAEWRYNPINWYSEDGSTTGWWYSEGDSWVTGWRYIDGKWYYFDNNGYMNCNKTVDGYKLGSDGAWVTTSTANTNVTKSDFEFDAKTGTITKYTGNKFDVVIPSTIDGVAVTSIGVSAFANFKNITSVVIPESVKNIGNGAFDGCIGLKSVTMPRGINIGPYAFGSYEDSGGFTHYTEGYCKDAKFYFKGDIVKRTSGFEIDKDTGTLKSYDDSATDVVIPNEIDGITVKSIGEKAFAGCTGVKSVTIPDSVTNIKSQAFTSCTSLTSIILSNNLTIIEDDTFSYCKNLKSIIIPKSVTSIGNNAFLECSSLTSVTIPSSVTRIGVSPFFGCKKSIFYVDNEKIKQLLIKSDVDESKVIVTGQSSTSNQVVTVKSNDKDETWKNWKAEVGVINDEAKTDESDRERSTEDYVTDKVTSIKLNSTSLNIVKKVGTNNPKLKVEILPSTVTSQDLIWKTSNEKVAIVDFVSGGVEVIPIGEGTATITCTSRDGSNKSATCEVTVTK